MFYWFRKFFLIGFFDTVERSILEISIVLCTPIFIEKILMKEWYRGRRQRGAFGRWRFEVGGKDDGRGTRGEGRWTKRS